MRGHNAPMEPSRIKPVLESLLFMAGDPLTVGNLKNILQVNENEISRAVHELADEYRSRDSGLLVAEVAGGVQMITNPSSAPWIKKLLTSVLPAKLSRQSLETLAIVAYKQPITKAEVESIRGVNSDGVMRTLLERRLVRILGRKEVPGRPLMYGTSREFLQYFGLKDLSELPTLKEFEDLERSGSETALEPQAVPSAEEGPLQETHTETILPD